MKKTKNVKKILKKPKFLGFFKIALEKTQKTHLKKPGFFQVGFFKLPTLIVEQVWSTNRCVLSTFFSTFNMDRQTDQKAYFPIEMQFYISVMFLGFPDEIHEEQVWSTNRCVLPTFFQLNSSVSKLNQPTDQPTDEQTLL